MSNGLLMVGYRSCKYARNVLNQSRCVPEMASVSLLQILLYSFLGCAISLLVHLFFDINIHQWSLILVQVAVTGLIFWGHFLIVRRRARRLLRRLTTPTQYHEWLHENQITEYVNTEMGEYIAEVRLFGI